MTSSLGCHDDRPTRTLACLRALPVKTILKVLYIMSAFQAFGYGTSTLPQLPPTALRAEASTLCPSCRGRPSTNTASSSLRYDAVGKPFTEADYDRALCTAFGAPLARRVREEYLTIAFPSPALAWATVLTDRYPARPASRHHQRIWRQADQAGSVPVPATPYPGAADVEFPGRAAPCPAAAAEHAGTAAPGAVRARSAPGLRVARPDSGRAAAHGAGVTVTGSLGHAPASWFRAVCSAGSMASFQRVLMATQSVKYRQR